MPKLNSSHLTTLGDLFLALAQSVGNYRMINRATLTKVQNQQIKDLHWTLLNLSDDFYTTSVRLSLPDVKDSLIKIQKVTTRINKTYSSLKSFQHAIDIAAATITLGSAIFSKHPVAINDAIEDLTRTIDKKS